MAVPHLPCITWPRQHGMAGLAPTFDTGRRSGATVVPPSDVWVSINGGTPTWIVFNGWFRGTPISGNLHIMIKLYMPALLVLNQISYLGGTSPSKVSLFLDVHSMAGRCGPRYTPLRSRCSVMSQHLVLWGLIFCGLRTEASSGYL